MIGLFSHMIGLFSHIIGLFSHMIGLFSHMIGLFSHMIRLFTSESRLLSHVYGCKRIPKLAVIHYGSFHIIHGFLYQIQEVFFTYMGADG